jgi:hypothetical protein
MKRPDLNHPAIQKMIGRRSKGDPEYFAGVRAFLTGADRPAEETTAFRGYLDAHDVVEYLSGILSDLQSEAWVEEIARERRSRCEGIQPVRSLNSERSDNVERIRPGVRMRI